ncbi:kinase suppressor of Ras 1-like [Symphalangus syndactylus]|uniref:kinase suppressor of Ras 1-like n=1 Tax=Symphalangus syndactylus TaxID=9590 RepID=UPI0030056940
MGEKEGGGGGDAASAEGGAGALASRALQYCGQLQKLVGISMGTLLELRTKCAVSNNLSQQEIQTMEVNKPGSFPHPNWLLGEPEASLCHNGGACNNWSGKPCLRLPFKKFIRLRRRWQFPTFP